MDSSTSKIISDESKGFVDISPFQPVSRDEIEKFGKEYEEALRKTEFCELDLMPKAIPENLGKIRKEVENRFKIENALLEVVKEIRGINPEIVKWIDDIY